MGYLTSLYTYRYIFPISMDGHVIRIEQEDLKFRFCSGHLVLAYEDTVEQMQSAYRTYVKIGAAGTDLISCLVCSDA